MGVIRIRPAPAVARSPCVTCRGISSRLHGFVFEDELAHGLYFVQWCDGAHPSRAATLTLGLGAFGDGSDEYDRLAFGLEWRAQGLALADRPAIDRPELLGRFLSRERVLEIQDVDHLWRVADQILRDDQRLVEVREWLSDRSV